MKNREWWILFRQWSVEVMDTKEALLAAFPNPVNPEVNLVHVIEHSALIAEKERAKKLVEALRYYANNEHNKALNVDTWETIKQHGGRLAKKAITEYEASVKE